MNELTPRQIVDELDLYIVGQSAAKRAVAIALRNRYRRRHMPTELRDELVPKNILMIGPTGVGKTEIARRLARLARAPFVKVEATKFTEVGYVGRDVESMIRDLAQASYRMVEAERMEAVREQAEAAVQDRLLDLLQPIPEREPYQPTLFAGYSSEGQSSAAQDEERYRKRLEQAERIRKRLKEQLEMGLLEERKVEIEVDDSPTISVTPVVGPGLEEMGSQLQEMLGNMLPRHRTSRKLTVADARHVLLQEECRKRVDPEAARREAVERAEQDGIVFVDELDKIAAREGASGGPDVSRGGVQRDLLPIIEGSTVQTKFGPVRTDYVLFIAAGAFHTSKPSDLIPELQGRLPIRVELESLTEADFRRILTEPQNALTRQYAAMLAVDNVEVEYRADGIQALARFAAEVNQRTENIGARRLHTMMERLLEECSFMAPDERLRKIVVDDEFVRERLESVAANQDLARYIL